MSDDKLESFKIGDTQRKGPRTKKKDEAEAQRKAESDASSIGFRRIEMLLDESSEEDIYGQLDSLHTQLDTFSESAKSHKDRAAVSRAKKAVLHTRELMAHLFDIRAQMSEPAAK